jgi:hypothetical protein
LIENIINEAMHDILEGSEFNGLLDECSSAKAGLYNTSITNQAEPALEDDLVQLAPSEDPVNKPTIVYEEEIKELADVDNSELFRKRMLLQQPFVDLMEFMMEDTLFNLMEEATYEEFDLTQPPQIYIRKE